MTTLLGKTNMDRAPGRLTVAGAFSLVFGDSPPVRFDAFDGSSTGPVDAPLRLLLRSKRGLDYLLTSPNSLGVTRAYLQGDLVIEPMDEGDPYEVLRYTRGQPGATSRPTVSDLPELARFVRQHLPRVPEPPKEETPESAAPDGARADPRPRPRRRGHPSPLRRVEPVLRAAPRPVDGVHVRGVPHRATRRWRPPRTRSSTWSAASSGCSPGCACSTSAAAGAAWCATR